ncbi:hypothetical protein [Campylobacter cuniculorum]|uniref:hypothetical protein n=1 Tax=Campylobacter cuniculorum TaxID=374106 RepID=UPI0023F46216|nr:hypothetical protein [Campylobacter cuniculorum]
MKNIVFSLLAVLSLSHLCEAKEVQGVDKEIKTKEYYQAHQDEAEAKMQWCYQKTGELREKGLVEMSDIDLKNCLSVRQISLFGF